MKIGINVISFIFGGIAGGAIAYFATRDIERSRADEEISSMKEFYAKKEAKLLERVEAADKRVEAAIKAKNTYEESCINLGVTLSELKKKQEEGSDTPKKDETDDDDDEDPALNDDIPIEGIDYYVHDIRKKDPYPITEAQYSEEMWEFFDKIVLNWYLGDNTLYTEGDEFVEDRYKIVGDLSRFSDGVKPGYEIYVRNELLGADYMIVAKNGYRPDNE